MFIHVNILYVVTYYIAAFHLVVQQHIPIISACNFELFLPPSLILSPSHLRTHSWYIIYA